jgi:hypothetical protein
MFSFILLKNAKNYSVLISNHLTMYISNLINNTLQCMGPSFTASANIGKKSANVLYADAVNKGIGNASLEK